MAIYLCKPKGCQRWWRQGGMAGQRRRGRGHWRDVATKWQPAATNGGGQVAGTGEAGVAACEV